MEDPNEPPPPLAASTNFSTLQAKIASQNICVAASQLLDLIRTLRMSALLMDESTIATEEESVCLRCTQQTEQIMKECRVLEMKLMDIRNNEDK
jgi:hypothetical protein